MTRVKAQWWGRERKGEERDARMQMRALLDVRPLARVGMRKRKMKETGNTQKGEEDNSRWRESRSSFREGILLPEESRSRTNFFASLWSQAAKTRELTEPRISAVKQAPPCFTDWTPYGHSPSKQLKRKFTFAKVKYLNLILSCLSDTYLPDTTTVWCKKIYTRSTVCFYAPFCILLKYLYFQGN